MKTDRKGMWGEDRQERAVGRGLTGQDVGRGMKGED